MCKSVYAHVQVDREKSLRDSGREDEAKYACWVYFFVAFLVCFGWIPSPGSESGAHVHSFDASEKEWYGLHINTRFCFLGFFY